MEGIALLCVGMFLGGSAAAARPVNDYIIYMPVITQHAGPVHVVEAIFVRSKFGEYLVKGNLQNLGPAPVYGMGVRVVVFDDLGQMHQIYTTTAELPAAFPGHFNRFSVYTTITDLDRDTARFDAQVISWTLQSDIPYWPLTVISSTVELNGSDVHVDARFRNDTAYPLSDLNIAMWELIYYLVDFGPAPSFLTPGESFTATGGMTNVDPDRVGLIKIEGLGQVNP